MPSLSMLPTSTEYKAWRPTGRLLQKWTAAFTEAQSTSGLTRRERHDKHIVFYRSKMEQSKLTMLYTEGPHAKKHRKSSSGDSRSSETTSNGSGIMGTSLPTKTKQATSPSKGTSLLGASFRKPCPKSVQKRIDNSQKLNAKLDEQKVSSPQASSLEPLSASF